jgi:uncharacterized protein YlxW (UPF0749 family)
MAALPRIGSAKGSNVFLTQPEPSCVAATPWLGTAGAFDAAAALVPCAAASPARAPRARVVRLSLARARPARLASPRSSLVRRQAPRAESPDDVTQTSQSTLLLLKKKEMMEVQIQLDRKKDECRRRMQRCLEHELELASKQNMLKDRVSKFDKFLRDNNAKRLRAVRKEHDEHKVHEQKLGEIGGLSDALKASSTERDAVESTLVESERYEAYLLQVCDMAEYFQEIPDILMRHATLAASSSEVVGRVHEVTAEAQRMRTQMAGFVKDAQTESLVLNSEIASLQTQFEEVVKTVEAREAALAREEGGAKARSRELGEINMAIQNIHSRCERAKAPSGKDAAGAPDFVDAAELSPLLAVIEHRIIDLQAVMRALRDVRAQRDVRRTAASPPPVGAEGTHAEASDSTAGPARHAGGGHGGGPGGGASGAQGGASSLGISASPSMASTFGASVAPGVS